MFYLRKDDEDLGFDLSAKETVFLSPGEVAKIETGTNVEFPLFGRVRRFITRLIFGMELTGIGAVVKPRSRNDYDVLAGVIDAGYRGEIVVKVYNPTDHDIFIPHAERFAQMVLVPQFHTSPKPVYSVDSLSHTKREGSGGIHVR